MSPMLVLLALLGFASTAQCCNDFLYNSSTGAISGRLLDLGPNLNPSVGYIPRGAQLEGLRVSLLSGIRKYQAVYGFALASSLQEEVAIIAAATGFTTPSVGGATDCLNEKGLSVGLLYDSLSEPPKYPNVTRNGDFISTFDFAAYACSQFADVSEVQQAFADGLKLAAAYDPLPQPAPSPYHFSVRDAQRNMLVIEYTPTDELRLYDASDIGVLTNNPDYATHLAQVESFLADGTNGALPTYLTAPQGAPDYVNVTFTDDNQLAITPQGDDQWWPFPGDYNSVSRFIRLYMLNRFAQTSTQYPTEANATWSPAAYPGGFPIKPLFMAAEGILNAVALPLGIDDKGGVNPPNITVADYWQLAVLRDHIGQQFWYKTPSSPQWKLIDVAQAAAQDPQPAYDGYFLASNYGDNTPWYLDYTKLVLSNAKDADITDQVGSILTAALSAENKG